MAFDDVLARDPKSEEEFWAIIEETFEQIEGSLTAYPMETREEALAGTCARQIQGRLNLVHSLSRNSGRAPS